MWRACAAIWQFFASVVSFIVSMPRRIAAFISELVNNLCMIVARISRKVVLPTILRSLELLGTFAVRLCRATLLFGPPAFLIYVAIESIDHLGDIVARSKDDSLINAVMASIGVTGLIAFAKTWRDDFVGALEPAWEYVFQSIGGTGLKGPPLKVIGRATIHTGTLALCGALMYVVTKNSIGPKPEATSPDGLPALFVVFQPQPSIDAGQQFASRGISIRIEPPAVHIEPPVIQLAPNISIPPPQIIAFATEPVSGLAGSSTLSGPPKFLLTFDEYPEPKNGTDCSTIDPSGSNAVTLKDPQIRALELLIARFRETCLGSPPSLLASSGRLPWIEMIVYGYAGTKDFLNCESKHDKKLNQTLADLRLGAVVTKLKDLTQPKKEDKDNQFLVRRESGAIVEAIDTKTDGNSLARSVAIAIANSGRCSTYVGQPIQIDDSLAKRLEPKKP